MAEEFADKDAVDAYIKQQFDAFANERDAAMQRQQQSGQGQDIDQVQQNVRQLVDPIYRPDIDQARLVAADAKDHVAFYRRHPEAVDIADKLEALFEDAVKNGRPTAREALHKYVLGEMMMTEPDKFAERQKAQLRQAEMAADLGVGGSGKPRNEGTLDDLKAMTLEDMEKALDGVTF